MSYLHLLLNHAISLNTVPQLLKSKQKKKLPVSLPVNQRGTDVSRCSYTVDQRYSFNVSKTKKTISQEDKHEIYLY